MTVRQSVGDRKRVAPGTLDRNHAAAYSLPIMSDASGSETGAVVSLWRYPVKSMMGEELNTAQVWEHGLVGDRAYALLDSSDGKVATAKNPRKWPNWRPKARVGTAELRWAYQSMHSAYGLSTQPGRSIRHRWPERCRPFMVIPRTRENAFLSNLSSAAWEEIRTGCFTLPTAKPCRG